MPLVDLKSVADRLRAEGTGLGAFNVVHVETAEALVEAAERAQRPVVLQISQNAVAFHGGRLEPIGAAALSVARSASVPVVVHLDHADDVELIDQAVELGFTSVMYDGSRLPYDENLHVTKSVVRACRDKGVSVEAELGEVGGKDGVHAPGARTEPEAAERFVETTGVDLLAVAVGSSHAMTERSAQLDLDLVADLAGALDVPLVLHGSSGVPDEGIVAAIRAGMTKINVSTHLNVLYTGRVRQYLEQNPKVVDPRKYVREGNAAVRDEVTRLLGLYVG